MTWSAAFKGPPFFLVLLSIYLLTLILVPSLSWRGAARLLRWRTSSAQHRLQGLTQLSWAVTWAVYGWGALHLLRDETATTDGCQTAVTEALGRAAAGSTDAYATSYFPLGLGCRVNGVGTFESAVPRYVNPTLFTMMAINLSLFVLRRRAQHKERATESSGRTSYP